MSDSSSNFDRFDTAACLAQYREQILQRDQRSVFQSILQPTRFSPTNPYVDDPSLTPFKLAMRRKFDILQYRNSAIGGAGGGMTAAQRWATLARTSSRRFAPNFYANTNYTVCDVSARTPVGSSGVPHGGDTEELYLDLATPQYQYEDPRLDRNYDTYTNVVPPPLTAIYYFGVPATAGAATPPQPWASLQVAAGEPGTTLDRVSVSVPLAITLAVGPRPSPIGPVLPVTVTVARVLQIYYNDTLAIAAPVSSVTLTLTLLAPTSAYATPFTITQYIGNLTADLDHIVPVSEGAVIFTARVQCTVSLTNSPAQTVVNVAVAANVPTTMANTNTPSGIAALTPVAARPFAAGSAVLSTVPA